MNALDTQKTVNRVFLHGFLSSQSGKIVTVDFVKKDGTARKLNGRLGVHKHLKGGDNTVMAPDRSYLTVYDMKSAGYRTVDLSTVSKVRAEKFDWVVVD